MTKELFESILGRRSIRQFEEREISNDLMRQILNAATLAPSAHNRQPWRFAVIKNREIKQLLATTMAERLRTDLTADGLATELIEKDVSRSIRRISNAPALILVCLSMADMDVYPDERRQHNERVMAIQSVAMAGQNIQLAASALGLGACWLCAPLFCPDEVKMSLSLPADWQPQGLVTLGYPAESRTKDRFPLSSRTLFFD